MSDLWMGQGKLLNYCLQATSVNAILDKDVQVIKPKTSSGSINQEPKS